MAQVFLVTFYFTMLWEADLKSFKPSRLGHVVLPQRHLGFFRKVLPDLGEKKSIFVIDIQYLFYLFLNLYMLTNNFFLLEGFTDCHAL